MLFFFDVTFFLSGVQGKYVKICLILYVYSTDSCHVDLTPPTQAAFDSLTDFGPESVQQAGQKTEQSLLSTTSWQKEIIWNDTKNENRVLGLVFWWLFRTVYTHCYLNLPSKMGTKHSKHPTFT